MPAHLASRPGILFVPFSINFNLVTIVIRDCFGFALLHFFTIGPGSLTPFCKPITFKLNPWSPLRFSRSFSSCWYYSEFSFALKKHFRCFHWSSLQLWFWFYNIYSKCSRACANDYTGKGRPRIAWIKPEKKLFYCWSRESFPSGLIRRSDIIVAIQNSDLCTFETFCNVNFHWFIRTQNPCNYANQSEHVLLSTWERFKKGILHKIIISFDKFNLCCSEDFWPSFVVCRTCATRFVPFLPTGGNR